MKHQITGLHSADLSSLDRTPDGVFLVRVQRVQFRRYAPKPYYTVALVVVEPRRFAGNVLSSRHLLQSQGAVEIQLVPAGLWLRQPSCSIAMRSMNIGLSGFGASSKSAMSFMTEFR